MIHRTIYIIIGILILIIGVIACSSFLNNSSHVWRTVNETIIYNGQPSPKSELYISPDELLLIDLRDQADGLYIVNPKTQEIGIPNESNFFTALGYVYSWDIRPSVAPMSKAETNPEIIIQPYEVEFTSVKKARVHVTWHLNL